MCRPTLLSDRRNARAATARDELQTAGTDPVHQQAGGPNFGFPVNVRLGWPGASSPGSFPRIHGMALSRHERPRHASVASAPTASTTAAHQFFSLRPGATELFFAWAELHGRTDPRPAVVTHGTSESTRGT
jgi:hypothetical protein